MAKWFVFSCAGGVDLKSQFVISREAAGAEPRAPGKVTKCDLKFFEGVLFSY